LNIRQTTKSKSTPKKMYLTFPQCGWYSIHRTGSVCVCAFLFIVLVLCVCVYVCVCCVMCKTSGGQRRHRKSSLSLIEMICITFTMQSNLSTAQQTTASLTLKPQMGSES